MTDQDAYRRYTAEAERLAELAKIPMYVTAPRDITEAEAHDLAEKLSERGFPKLAFIPNTVQVSPNTIQLAQVYATLALAAAQERVQPANRPTEGPTVVKDGEGDIWHRTPSGTYSATGGSDLTDNFTLDQIAKAFGGYTEVT